jgi:hypothetical protein
MTHDWKLGAWGLLPTDSAVSHRESESGPKARVVGP